MTVKLSGSMPKDEQINNGLAAIADQLAEEALADETVDHVIICIVRQNGGGKKPGQGFAPTVRPAAIEVATGDRAIAARAILDEERVARGLHPLTGGTLFDHEDQADD